MCPRKGLAGFRKREMLGVRQNGAHGGGVWAKIIRYNKVRLGGSPVFRISYTSTYVARM